MITVNSFWTDTISLDPGAMDRTLTDLMSGELLLAVSI